MKLTGRRRRVTAPFSAASRDGGRGNLSSIEELFQEGDSRDYPVSFTIRVTARDERTGKMALLFSSAKRTKRWVEPLGEDMGVPQGTLLVNQGWSRVTIPSTDLAMQMLTVFYVAPVEGQPETISAAERLYSVLTLDCAFMLQCKTEVGWEAKKSRAGSGWEAVRREMSEKRFRPGLIFLFFFLSSCTAGSRADRTLHPGRLGEWAGRGTGWLTG
jgi:hypothetical protein